MPLAHHVGLVVEATGDRDVDDAAGRAQEQPAGLLEPKTRAAAFGAMPNSEMKRSPKWRRLKPMSRASS